MKKKWILLMVVTFMIFVGIGIIIYDFGKDKILFPPKVTNDILLNKGTFLGEISVDKTLNGVYNFVCNYELNEDGSATFVSNEYWQSYNDIVPKETYDLLKSLSSKKLLEISYIEEGILAIYYSDSGATILIIELDQKYNVIFEYELKVKDTYTVPCSTVFSDKESLFIVSYEEEKDTVYITKVNKKSREEVVYSFTWQQLSGQTDKSHSLSGFVFKPSTIWIRDNLLYFAETNIKKDSDAVIAVYDLAEEKSLNCRVFQNSQVVQAQKSKSSFFVLINHGSNNLLVLYEFDMNTFEEKSKVLLPIPEEAVSQDSEVLDFLFNCDRDDEQIAIIFPDIKRTENIDASIGTVILAVYDRQTGELEYKSRLGVASKYEVSEVLINKYKKHTQMNTPVSQFLILAVHYK
ncbi:hypothetical protein [Cellulosilyticum sp. I15G10I2]|uniref:hypothetical protein n=1 Tax=Cellulosilyticum sp. I15G10I2 TaxID=1892843 RepID=UPI00085C6BD1|nr:hypothetical protein [Cellulosilyticum sp. I15G10I2]